MKNMRISMKLIVSFVIVIVLAIIVAVVGAVGMYQINAADDAMYEGNYLPTVMAEKISQTVMAQRAAMLKLVLYDINNDATIFKNTEADLENLKAAMDQLIKEYDPTIVNAEDRAAFDDFKALYTGDWSRLIDDVHNLGVNNQANEAKALIGANATTASKLDELTTKLSDINIADGKTTVDGNSVLFTNMLIIEIVVLTVAVIVSMVLALYISGLISKPVTFMKNVLQMMGMEGVVNFTDEEYRQAEEFATSKDEIGESIGMLIRTGRHLEDVGKVLDTVASGDLTPEISLLSGRDTIGVSLTSMLDNLKICSAKLRQLPIRSLPDRIKYLRAHRNWLPAQASRPLA